MKWRNSFILTAIVMLIIGIVGVSLPTAAQTDDEGQPTPDVSGLASEIPQESGLHTLVIEHNGFNRVYVLFVPESYSTWQATPIAFFFHGGRGNAQNFARQRAALIDKANAENMILVFPQATFNESFNGTRWVAETVPFNGEPPLTDDVDFVLTLLDTLTEVLSIDRSRVYAAGFSNGGTFTHFLGATAGENFAAIAAIGTSIGATKEPDGPIVYPPEPFVPLSILIISGGLDERRPIEGGTNERGNLVPSTQEGVDFWVSNNGCTDIPELIVRHSETVTIKHYAEDCEENAEVVFVTLSLMPHTWPDADKDFNFDGNMTVIDFFMQHQRSPSEAD